MVNIQSTSLGYLKNFLCLTFLCLHAFASAVEFPAFNPVQRAQSYWKSDQEEDAKLYKGEKPRLITSGYYEHGCYINFSVDRTAFGWAMVAGTAVRMGVAISNTGTKYETFRTAILRPGIAKSALFWGPALVAYNWVMNRKRTQFIENLLQKAQQDQMLERLQNQAGRNDH